MSLNGFKHTDKQIIPVNFNSFFFHFIIFNNEKQCKENINKYDKVRRNIPQYLLMKIIKFLIM